jgi:hypothetical protein
MFINHVNPCDSLVTAPLDGIEISVVQWEPRFGIFAPSLHYPTLSPIGLPKFWQAAMSSNGGPTNELHER